MKRLSICLVIVFLFGVNSLVFAGSDLLKEGLIGAGAGAVGSSVGRHGHVWKGALAGAGVSVVGNAILDSHSQEHVDSVPQVSSMSSMDSYQEGYKTGYNNGFKAGYAQGYKDGVQDTLKHSK